jgi:hypothetical protein
MPDFKETTGVTFGEGGGTPVADVSQPGVADAASSHRIVPMAAKLCAECPPETANISGHDRCVDCPRRWRQEHG